MKTEEHNGVKTGCGRWLMDVCTLAITGVVFGLVGCGTLPDVKPYAAATLQLEKSVQQGFGESAKAQQQMAALLTVPATSPAFGETDPLRQRYEFAAKEILEQAEPRLKLLRALTDYSDSLAAIVEAADHAQANVQALGDSIAGLVTTVKATPIPAAAQSVIELAEVAARELVKLRAAHDLQEALEAADPIVQQVTKVVVADIASLRRTVGTKDAAVAAALDLTESTRLKYRERLEKRRSELMDALSRLTDNAIEADASSANLAKLEEQIRTSDLWHAPLIARRDEALAQLKAAEQLYQSADLAVRAWGDAHADLVKAVRDNRGVNVRRLVEIVAEVRGIVDRMKKKEAGNAGQ